ncbi:MAG: thiN [Firmicutes bacterium]|nr:thiN [Bacillota bacterium]
MRAGNCYVFGAGEDFGDFPQPAPGDFVIAADGGYSRLEARGISADLIIGDFDSLDTPPQGDHVVRLPREKDHTDMLAAILVGLQQGFRRFHIYGGTGGRFDHTMANLQCLAFIAEAGARGFLYGADQVSTILKNGKISFPSEAVGLISAFAYTDIALGVTEQGLQYRLDAATMKNTYPRGVSNAFTGVPSTITVEEGMLLVIYPKGVAPLDEV